MDNWKRNKEFERFTKRQLKIMQSKAKDYATEDVLNNFKVAGPSAGITPEQQCLSQIAQKVARLGVLLKGQKPNHESIEDSIIDLANYAFNLHCLRNE